MTARYAVTFALIFVLGLVAVPVGGGPLHEAARGGDVAAIANFIAGGANVEAPDDAGLTPLVAAALAGQSESVARLIVQGADPLGRDEKGFTALHAAVHAGHPSIVAMLLDHGVDPSDAENFAEITPLHLAAERGFVEIAKILLDRGADLHVPSGVGHMPVTMAVLNTHPAMVALLRGRGAQCEKLKMERYRDYCLKAEP